VVHILLIILFEKYLISSLSTSISFFKVLVMLKRGRQLLILPMKLVIYFLLF